MRNFIDKFFFRSNNLDYISQNIKNLSNKTPANKIFEAINSYSNESEIRYVGGCIRKIINKENVDDVDLATNLEPYQICEALKKNNIQFHETGLAHGTITALIDEFKFEITTLREDIATDGRHAKVRFSKNWKEDSLRRDFTINSIYSDQTGNLFDPNNGKKDLEAGNINFIGNADKRIKEDYLRILRYLRFFINYSKQPHNSEIIRKIKINIGGVTNISKERLLDELKKITKLDSLEKLTKDKISLNLILTIFPELENISIFSKLSPLKKSLLKENDFILFLSLMIISKNDNTDYFLYKYNISKKDQKRIKNIDNFYKNKLQSKIFSENNLNKIFYFDGNQAVIDILVFEIIKSKKLDNNLKKLIEVYKNKTIPKMPISAEMIMKKFNIPEGKELGLKLKIIEKEWVENNFKISNQKIDYIIKD